MEEDALKPLTFVWLRNRAGFPTRMTKTGDYMWNHIPNEFLLTKKHYLALHIRQYVHKMGSSMKNERLREIHPETFVLENENERILFFEAIKESEKKRKAIQEKAKAEKDDTEKTKFLLDNTTLWIIKPVDSSGGNGIGVVDSFKEFSEQYLCAKPAYVPRRGMGSNFAKNGSIVPKNNLESSSSSSTATASSLAASIVSSAASWIQGALEGLTTAPSSSSEVNEKEEKNEMQISTSKRGSSPAGTKKEEEEEELSEEKGEKKGENEVWVVSPKTAEEALKSPSAIHLCRSLIAQRYIASPLLLNGHKFDIRAYMYIADVDPPLVFYHDGYLRVNIEPYDTDNLDNKWSHISNIGLQKAHPEYEEKKIETKWSFKTWQAHMLDKGLTNDPHWVTNVIKPQLRDIMEVAYRSVLPKFREHGGCGSFALLGVDFLIDANHRAWLLEYTKTPAGHSTLEADDTLFADLMDELVAMQLELHFSKRTSDSEAYPPDFHLDSQKNFVRIV